MNRLDTLLRFHEEDPDDAFVRFAVAQEFLKAGRSDEALAWFERLVSDRPDYVGAYYHLGQLLRRLGRTEEAVRTFESGIAEANRQRDVHARSELQSALMEARGMGDDEA